MERPQSIRIFELCYLGALAVGLVNALTHWSIISGTADARKLMRIAPWLLPITTSVSFIVPLILWFFVARWGSLVAKWIVVIFAGFAVLKALLGLVTSGFPTPLFEGLAFTALVLNLIAAAMLFRADAKPWFGETPAPPAGGAA